MGRTLRPGTRNAAKPTFMAKVEPPDFCAKTDKPVPRHGRASAPFGIPLRSVARGQTPKSSPEVLQLALGLPLKDHGSVNDVARLCAGSSHGGEVVEAPTMRVQLSSRATAAFGHRRSRPMRHLIFFVPSNRGIEIARFETAATRRVGETLRVRLWPPRRATPALSGSGSRCPNCCGSDAAAALYGECGESPPAGKMGSALLRCEIILSCGDPVHPSRWIAEVLPSQRCEQAARIACGTGQAHSRIA